MNSISLSSPLARPELIPTPKFELKKSLANTLSKKDQVFS